MRNTFRRLNAAIDRLLTLSERNAAGRLGIFRILYAAYYLWGFSSITPRNLHELPVEMHWPILVNRWLPAPPPLILLDALSALLVAGLVFLLAGYKTRTATAVVLGAGGLLESYFVSADPEKSGVFLVAYIPFFMLISGNWGATHSLDALLRRRAGFHATDPSDTSAQFVLPIRASLILLAILFFSAAAYKITNPTHWFGQDHFMAYDALKRRIESTIRGFSPNPFAELLYRHSTLDDASRWGLWCFELTFFLACVNARWRAFYVSFALVFHAISMIWFGVTFSAVVVVYGLFIDWEAMLPKRRRASLPRWRVPSSALRTATVLMAIAAAILWNHSHYIREVMSLGGLLDARTLWMPILPIAAVWWIASVFEIARSPRDLFRFGD